jgi:ankyrin repeat protein
MSACQTGHADIARLLVQHGAVVNAADHSDRCSLVYAAEGGHLDIVELLASCDWQCYKKTDLALKEAAQQATVVAAANGKIEVNPGVRYPVMFGPSFQL